MEVFDFMYENVIMLKEGYYELSSLRAFIRGSLGIQKYIKN